MSFRCAAKITSRCKHCGHGFRVTPLGNSSYCSKDCQTCARFANAFADSKDCRSVKENKQAVYEFAEAIHALEEKSTLTLCNTARDNSISSSGSGSPTSPHTPRDAADTSPPVSPYGPKKEQTSPRKSLFRSLLGRG